MTFAAGTLDAVLVPRHSGINPWRQPSERFERADRDKRDPALVDDHLDLLAGLQLERLPDGGWNDHLYLGESLTAGIYRSGKASPESNALIRVVQRYLYRS